MATGVFFEDGSVIWVDISAVAKTPVVIMICIPITCDGPMRTAHFPFPDPVDFKIPRVTTLAPPNVFSRTSTCLLSRVLEHGSGFPTRCIFARKRTIATGPDGWKCHYDGSFRPFMIPTIPQERKTKLPKQRHASGRPRRDCASRSSDSELSLSEISPSLAPEETDSGNVGTPISNHSDEERSGDLMFWFSNDEAEKPPPMVASNREADVPLIDRPRIVSRQRDYIQDQLAGKIDPHRYTLLANTIDAIVAVRWREVERTSCL